MRLSVKLLNEVAERLERKNRAYAGGQHKHINFIIGKDVLNYDEAWQAALAYATKHIATLLTWFREGKLPEDSERVAEVLGDIIAYMALIYEIHEEAKRAEEEGDHWVSSTTYP